MFFTYYFIITTIYIIFIFFLVLGVLGFWGFGVIGGVVFALFIRRKNEEPPPPIKVVPEAIVVGQLEEGNSFTDKDTFW